MKGKGLLIAAFTAIFLCILAIFPHQGEEAKAVTQESEAQEEFLREVEGLLDELDTEELQQYLNSLSEFRGISVKERLAALLKGDYALDYASLAQTILSLVWQEAKAMLPAFAVIVAVTLLCGILNSAKSGIMRSTMSDIIDFVGFITAGAAVLSCLIGVLEVGFSAIQSMKRQMELVFPLLITLMAASGGSVSAGVYRPAVAFMSGGITDLFISVILPTSVVVIVLSFLGDLSSDVRTERLGELFKSISKWLIGLTLGMFSLFLTVQGISSAQYDGLSLRAAKYLIAGSVPVVGNFLSGGVELVVAGSALIRNALGSFSVFLLFASVLRPVLLFAAFQLFLRLSAAATEPVGGKMSGFLSRLASDSGYFLAGILVVAFLYFLTVLLLVCSAGAIL